MLRWLYRLADRSRDRARRRQWTQSRATGRRGEDLAHRHLQQLGYAVVARNWQREEGGGEIDLIAWDSSEPPGVLVFVEVKSRQSDEFGAPERAVGDEKRQTMIRAAWIYARRARVPWNQVRFDIVTIVFGTPPEITHLRDAFGKE